MSFVKKQAVPEKFSSLFRQVICVICLEKNEVPSIESIFERISALKIRDVLLLNIFEDESEIDQESSAWTWCRMTLYSFMKSVGFVHEERVSHYE